MLVFLFFGFTWPEMMCLCLWDISMSPSTGFAPVFSLPSFSSFLFLRSFNCSFPLWTLLFGSSARNFNLYWTVCLPCSLSPPSAFRPHLPSKSLVFLSSLALLPLSLWSCIFTPLVSEGLQHSVSATEPEKGEGQVQGTKCLSLGRVRVSVGSLLSHPSAASAWRLGTH